MNIIIKLKDFFPLNAKSAQELREAIFQELQNAEDVLVILDDDGLEGGLPPMFFYRAIGNLHEDDANRIEFVTRTMPSRRDKFLYAQRQTIESLEHLKRRNEMAEKIDKFMLYFFLPFSLVFIFGGLGFVVYRNSQITNNVYNKVNSTMSEYILTSLEK